jgi:hypothetical protein
MCVSEEDTANTLEEFMDANDAPSPNDTEHPWPSAQLLALDRVRDAELAKVLNKSEILIVCFYQKQSSSLALIFRTITRRITQLWGGFLGSCVTSCMNIHTRSGLDYVPEDERDVHAVLDRCLVRDADGADIFTFGGIAIRSEHHKGTVRVRSRPFVSDPFRGRNPQVYAKTLACLLDAII